MKSINGIKRMIAVILMICMVLMSGCTGSEEPTTAPTNAPTSEAKITFVVADKTNWDKEVTLNGFAYTLNVNILADGKLELVGTCTGKPQAAAGGQQGGSGGGEVEETEPPVTEAPMTDAEKAAKNFTKTGTWTYEAGYGYTLTINGYTTKTNWDKASGRHYFYAEINVDGASTGLIQFQGKDSGFRKEVASDYEDFEIRDAKIIFTASGTTATGNASQTQLYLEKDGTANSVGVSGSSTTYTRGTWVENANKSITVTIGGSEYVAAYCDIAGKEGYRITYSSNTMYYTLSGAEITYTDEDFNGKVIATLQCAEQDYTLELTEKGFAVLKEKGAVSSTGSYTKDGDVYTISVAGGTFVSEGNLITISYEKQGDSCNTTVVNRTFALDGTVPEGTAAPVETEPAGEGSEGGESEGGEPAATEPVEGGESEGGESEGGEPAASEPAEGESEGGESEGGESEGGEPAETEPAASEPAEGESEGGESEGGESEGGEPAEGESEGGESEGGESEGGEA